MTDNTLTCNGLSHDDLIDSLAAALGNDWAPHHDDTVSWPKGIQHTHSGLRITVSRDSHPRKSRLNVHIAGWPTVDPNDRRRSHSIGELVGPWSISPRQESPSISVSADKSPANVARDIERRLLPDAFRIYALCVERAEQNWALHNKSVDLYSQLRDILGVVDDRGKATVTGADSKIRIGSTHARLYGDVTVSYSGDSVEFHVRYVPPASAIRLAEFLAVLLKGEVAS